MADYPQNYHSWTDVEDDVDTIYASHVNDAHNELIAIENVLNKLQSIISEWKIEKDYVEGLEVNYVSASEVDVTAGYVAISGTLCYLSETTRLTMPDDLMPGETESNYDFYYVYASNIISGVSLKFSKYDPDSNFMHPNETGWRAIGGIYNYAGNFRNQKQIGDFVVIDKFLAYNANPGTSIVTYSAQSFLPNFAKSIFLMCGTSADSSGESFWGFYNFFSLTFNQADWRIQNIGDGGNFTFSFEYFTSDRKIYFKKVAGAWLSMYITGYKMQRIRGR